MMAFPRGYRHNNWVPFLKVVVTQTARHYACYFYEHHVGSMLNTDLLLNSELPKEITDLAIAAVEEWKAWYLVEGISYESSKCRHPFHKALVKTIEWIESHVSVAASCFAMTLVESFEN
jgi:hypothetical protein